MNNFQQILATIQYYQSLIHDDDNWRTKLEFLHSVLNPQI